MPCPEPASLYLRALDLPAPAELADLFSAVYPLSAEEAFHRARHCHGALAENRPADEIARLEQACARAGLKTLRWDGPAPEPAQAEPATAFSFDDGGFSCALRGGLVLPGRWDEVAIAAAAPQRETITRKETVFEHPSVLKTAGKVALAMSGIPLPLGGAGQSSREVQLNEMNYVLDLYFGGRRVRLRSDRLDYSALGDAKSYSSQGNFRVIACAVMPRASRALANKGLRLIAARQPLQALFYDDPSDFERDFRRLFALFSRPAQG